jgi:hypothetical protein
MAALSRRTRCCHFSAREVIVMRVMKPDTLRHALIVALMGSITLVGSALSYQLLM